MISIVDILAEVDRLPTLNATVVRLMGMLHDDDIGFGDIEKVIRTDPALTANLLRTANTAYFATSRRVESVTQAISVLGLRRLVDVVTLSAMAEVIPEKLPGYGLSAQAFWRHCVAVAVLAESLGRRLETGRSGLAFTAGLLHDLGKLVISTFLARQPGAASAPPMRLTSIESERAALGTDHARIGKAIAEAWRLPHAVALVNQSHHAPGEAEDDSHSDDYTVTLVHVADGMAHAFGFGGGLSDPQPVFSQSALDRLKLGQRQAEQVAWASLEHIEILAATRPNA
jgi:putative nucleotidyltransferase with HDIG domain